MGSRESRISAVVPYTAAGVSPVLTMDVYPAGGRALPAHPAVLLLHGGGFVGGSSRSESEAYCADFLQPAGYAVFSVNYRLAPAAHLQEMVADVQRAVRYVRHNAARFRVDPGRIALLGGSAGGYLSNMAGLVPSDGIARAVDPVDRESAAVQAVVTLYGLSDLSTLGAEMLIRTYRLLGPRAVTPETLLETSPMGQVRAGAPPFLLIHGDRDAMVPMAQSTRFAEALRAKGGAAEVLTIAGGPHATQTWHALATPNDWERRTVQWLNRTFQHTGIPGEGILRRTA